MGAAEANSGIQPAKAPLTAKSLKKQGENFIAEDFNSERYQSERLRMLIHEPKKKKKFEYPMVQKFHNQIKQLLSMHYRGKNTLRELKTHVKLEIVQTVDEEFKENYNYMKQ